MAKDNTKTADAEDSIPIPPMQRLLDNHFLLLFIGVVVPTVLYLLWGVMELSQIPIAE
jgi:cytochrome c oxidase subunit 2